MAQKRSSYVVQIILGLFILLALFTVFATVAIIDLRTVPERYGHINEEGFVCEPASHGNGIYTFSCAEYEIGRSLSSFIEANPHLRITAITSTAFCTFGRQRERGYVISTE
jgi:hypothetical protein